MHIDDLIKQIRPYIPFRSEKSAQDFIDRFERSDRIAFISAMYFGRSHLHYNEVMEDYLDKLLSGEMNRHWDSINVPENEIARVLYEKNTNLTSYYDAFIRCTDGSGYDRRNY